MNVSKHTQLPWRAIEIGGEQRVRIVAGDSSDYRIICDLDTCWDEEGNAEQRANAKLIIAAPELLDVLVGLYNDQVDYLTINQLGGMDNHWMKAARAVIAKAMGAA